MKATKKPVTIECFKYDGDLKNSDGKFYVPEWAQKAYEDGTIFFKDQGEMYIKTLEGVHHASVGDYIIRGVNGELYPCKPDIFEKTYNIETSDTSSFVPDDNEYGLINEEANAQAVDTRSETPNRKVRTVDEELFNIAAERAQIGDRIKKLEGAIKADPPAVSDKHKRLWRMQLSAMEFYYNALGDRISDFVDQTQRGEAVPGTDPA